MVPLKFGVLKLQTKWPKYIILHHTAELPINQAGLKFDDQKFQLGKLELLNYSMTQDPNLKYHFVIDRVGSDFYPIVSRPLFTDPGWEDILPQYQRSIHIGIVGDYDHDIPMTRMYSILSYRLLFPLMRMFSIPDENVLLHKVVSEIPDLVCPGELFDMHKLRSIMRSYRRKSVLARG